MPSVTWSKDGVVLVNSTRITIFENQVTESGFTFVKSMLEICTTQVADSGQYSCSIGNEVSNTSAGFEVSVIVDGGGEHYINNILTIYGPEVIVQE